MEPSGAPLVGLLSVNVGKPAFLGERRGEIVESGIRKRSVPGGMITISSTNLAGDGQADLHNHGGSEKAVYAYPSEHLQHWSAELKPAAPFDPGSFGENLSTTGWLESETFIGDVWQWGDAVLQVCQPRYPCYKLAMSTGFPGVVKAMVANGRTGWYLRVLEPGQAPVGGPITIIERGQNRVTVADGHLARLPGTPFAIVERAASAPALARGLRQEFLRLLETRMTP